MVYKCVILNTLYSIYDDDVNIKDFSVLCEETFSSVKKTCFSTTQFFVFSCIDQ